jgi:hypothetical protein
MNASQLHSSAKEKTCMIECLINEDPQIQPDLQADQDVETEDGPQTGDLEIQLQYFSPDVSGKAAGNAAVAACCQAFTRAFLATLDGNLNNEISARADGADAYRRALPPLNGNRNIRNFVACIAHGILINVLSNNAAGRLLYAAQVAHTMARKSKK